MAYGWVIGTTIGNMKSTGQGGGGIHGYYGKGQYYSRKVFIGNNWSYNNKVQP